MHLHLDPRAKFPSELETTRTENKTAIDLILGWRYEQAHKNSARRVCPMCHRDFEEAQTEQDSV